LVTDKFLQKYSLTKEDLLQDLELISQSREIGNLARKEVFLGKASFSVSGDGKELPQAVLSRYFQNGDIRSGYYRDQTILLANKTLSAQQFFAQVYAHSSLKDEPVSAGRLMSGHFGTPFLNKDGDWLPLKELKNSTTDISPTAGQMPRLLGLAYASKLYRQNPALHTENNFSREGNEIAFGTIGNASCAEGLFFETVNAGGVLQVPMLISIWDDDYGISVPNHLQMTKSDVSEALSGFQRTEEKEGYEIFRVKGWDYPNLIKTYAQATKICREQHVPVIVHVTELTQPYGHSSSGSHERYKSKERLDWERAHDCNDKFENWLLNENIASQEEIDQAIGNGKALAKVGRDKAWKSFQNELKDDKALTISLLENLIESSQHKAKLQTLRDGLGNEMYLLKKHIAQAVKQALRITLYEEKSATRKELMDWNNKIRLITHEHFSGSLNNTYKDSAMNVKIVPAEYSDNSQSVDGYLVINKFFDLKFAEDPRLFAIGEDVGFIGDVNQGFAGLQEKYGDLRVTDTGIREATIMGQGIGAAMRGLKPIAEIQYLDYILYAFQTMSDDLATLQYRSFSQQKAPLIVRTRGHRLQGVWHSGSPIGLLINGLRGIHICAPRSMVQACGMYNTLLKSGDPGLVIECLNGYRLKESVPDNLNEHTVNLGEIEVLQEGTDITIITYGAMCRVVMKAAEELAKHNISCEVIDVQTLLPFDRNQQCLESIKKTNRVLFADEDVPGGATAYMMQQVVEKQEAYYHLDSKPKSISSWSHRPAYAVDGDYFSKPNEDDVFDYVYGMMRESNPEKFPELF
jgi:2-oxoisovalerate dehydrogenase E1 component